MKHTEVILILAGILFFALSTPAQSRLVHVEWQYPLSNNVEGFRLYLDNNPVCETTDPNANAMDCTIDAADGEARFTLTSFWSDGTESPPSNIFTYIFSSTLKAVLIADPLQGESPLTVTFDAANSTGNIVTYEWMFGDGETGTGNRISHRNESS